MVDLGGYVIVLVETKDKRIKLYGSPADKADLEIGDEILEVNGRTLSTSTHAEIISHIHQCIRSRTICLRVKRRGGDKLALDLAESNIVQDAFVIAVEQRARQRLERLSALRKIKPVDMTQLSQQLSDSERAGGGAQDRGDLSGLIESNSVYVTSLPTLSNGRHRAASSSKTAAVPVAPSSGDPCSSNAAVTSLDVSAELELHHTASSSTLPRGSSAHQQQRRPISAQDRSSSVGGSDTTGYSQAVSAQARSDGDLATVAMETFKPHSHRSPPPPPPRTATVLPPADVTLNNARENGQQMAPPVQLPSNKQRPLFLSHNDSKRSSKESLSSHKSSRTASSAGGGVGGGVGGVAGVGGVSTGYGSSSHSGSLEHLEAVMSELDRGPHREMAVDVPESFIARTKTPPRYPPPKHRGGTAAGRANGSAVGQHAPPPPPAPAPRPSLDRERQGSAVSQGSDQMGRIRKYQEDIRREREMRDARAREQDLLRSSLRGSEKMKQLEKRPAPAGMINNGYINQEHRLDPLDQQLTSPYSDIEVADLLAALREAQVTLRSNGHEALQRELASAHALLAAPEFQHVLAVHNKARQLWCYTAPPPPLCQNLSDVVQDVVGMVHEWHAPDWVELVDLLTSFEMEGLVYAHDHIATRGAVPGSPTPPEDADDFADHVHHYTDPRIRVVRLEKSSEPLGATVKNEGGSVLIGRIVKGGTAEKSGLLKPGDEILEVNGIEMRSKSVDDVCDILAGMSGSLVFIILPNEDEPLEKPKPQQTVMHVKAHFDYDPDDDIYLPCREIGMSFQKGDILHITSQEDADWWQATRDGDEDVTLSGLVPSLQFQQQREAVRQSVIDDCRSRRTSSATDKRSSLIGGVGSGGALLCARRANRKKKKMYNAEFGDDYEVTELLTYEEVGLYYPRANQKRPVVLIGPPNIGRHELRQKLMEDTDRFSAAVPHTSRPRKDNEMNGQDYHFISRPQFEADIVNRLFVEHGEYEKSYYGTSIGAIRSVVDSGKTCVLNLHPHSLKILKHTDLKPFVVFVAPPSLEKLRQIKHRSGEMLRDDELKMTIEKAREMEDVYGHYFDIVLVNSDLSRAYEQLVQEITVLEREPQWVPVSWLRQDST